MAFNSSKNYGPVTMEQIMIGSDDEEEDADNMEEIAGDLQYSEQIIIARNKEQRRKMIKAVALGVLAVSALIGVGVGIGMFYVKRETASTPGGNVGAAAAIQGDDYYVDESSDDPQLTHINPPPDDLKDFCSPFSVQSKMGFSQCKDRCQDAACCLPFLGEEQTCLKNNEKSCAEYDTFCEILKFDHDGDGKVDYHEEVEVPPPPSNLREVCEWDELTNVEGFKKCEAACEKGKCCYESIETCEVTNPGMCDQYDACAILHVQEVITVPKPVPNLETLCSADSIVETTGYKACKDACEPGSCCHEPIETCKVQNPEMCKDYSECTILSGNPQTHPDAVHSQVQVKCTTTNMKTAAGVRQCQEACNPGLCCVGGVDGKGEMCNFPEYADWCDQYAGCNLLHHVDDDGFGSNKNAKSAVDEACSDFSVRGVAACENVCEPAECCFRLDEDCGEIGMPDLKCEHYEPCGHLYVDSKDPNLSTVPHYEAKKTLDFENENLMDEATAIVEVCTTDNLESSDGLNACTDLCQDKLCCFADVEKNCIKTFGELCIIYAGCEPLYDYYNP